MTTAGDLRESIRLEEQVPGGDDGYGNTLPDTWTARSNFPARIRVLKGNETVFAARLTGTQTVVITGRWHDDMSAATTAWRAVDARRGTIFNIRSITPSERGDYFDILAQSGVAT